MSELGGAEAHREGGPRKPRKVCAYGVRGRWEKIDRWAVAEQWNLFEVKLNHFDVAAAVKWGK